MAKKALTTTVPVPGHALSALELRAAAEFFEESATNYLDHSSNEFELPDTPVRREIVHAADQLYQRACGRQPDELRVHRRRLQLTDYILFYYYARRWAWLAQEVERGATITPPLAQEDLLTAASLLKLLSRNDYEEYAYNSDDPDHALPPTDEGRQLAEAVIRHKRRRDTEKRVKAVLAGEYGCEVHTTWLFAYLSARCEAIAQQSPAVGYGFEGDYPVVARADEGQASPQMPETGPGGLPLLKRRGISSKWLTGWKKQVKDLQIVVAQDNTYYYYSLQPLNAFLRHGFDDNHYMNLLVAFLTHGFDDRYWEGKADFGWLGCSLSGHRRPIALLEHDVLEQQSYNVKDWMPGFMAVYFGTMMETWYFIRNRLERGVSADNGNFVALGMVIGYKNEALTMAKAMIVAYRRKLFHKEFCPVAKCIVKMFADYLNLPPITLEGEAVTNPTYAALAAHWRHPDTEALVPVLLAVCDEHTHRTMRAANKRYMNCWDFSEFERTPVEILLVFKLRQELGLSNPKLDHPLMNTLLAQLPEKMPFFMDEVLTAVLKRARAEGFDINQALTDIDKAAAQA